MFAFNHIFGNFLFTAKPCASCATVFKETIRSLSTTILTVLLVLCLIYIKCKNLFNRHDNISSILTGLGSTRVSSNQTHYCPCKLRMSRYSNEKQLADCYIDMIRSAVYVFTLQIYCAESRYLKFCRARNFSRFPDKFLESTRIIFVCCSNNTFDPNLTLIFSHSKYYVQYNIC